MNKEIRVVFAHAQETDIAIKAIVKDGTIWTTQASMVDLFGLSPVAINNHLQNIYADEELSEDATVSEMEIVHYDGGRRVKRSATFYNLDVIISVGYRINSRQATKFRIWATGILKEYMTKGFTMDDEHLKRGNSVYSKDHFRELLERVRSIRTSERRIWQQITDVFAECCIDYDKSSETARRFYATVLNKFYYAIAVQNSVDTMPDEKTVVKNCLDEEQIRQLERCASDFFDYIEDLIERENTFTMEEFAASATAFLEFRRYNLLSDTEIILPKQV